MALGKISSLGFASGLLKQDTIDQLKQDEEKVRITPYKTKIEANTTKKKDLTEILTKLTAFQGKVASLGDSTTFLARKVLPSISENPPASLSVNSGVAVQSLNLSVAQIAQKDVYQSKALANKGGYVAASLTTGTRFTIFQNDKSYEIAVDKNTTFEDLVSRINEASGGKIIAKLVNTGEAGTPYRLTLSSKETGEANKIAFFDGAKDDKGVLTEDAEAAKVFTTLGWSLDKGTTGSAATPVSGGGATTLPADFKGYGLTAPTSGGEKYHIQNAQNAEFTLDGIKMTRASNNISDITVGLNLTLKKTGDITFEIQQSTDGLAKTMEELATAYNDLVTNLNASTDYDPKKGTAGTLQGVSEVNTIRSRIVQALFATQSIAGQVLDENGRASSDSVLLSVFDYGLSMTNAGTLNFDAEKFNKKLSEAGADLAEKFFVGDPSYDPISYYGNNVAKDSLKEYFDTPQQNTQNTQLKGLLINSGDFSIVFNGTTYDVSRGENDSLFRIKGKDDEEMMKALATHINGLGIEGLSVSVVSDNNNYRLKFAGKDSSDFEIKGRADFLGKLGLAENTINPRYNEGAGVFSKLQSLLKTMTDKKTGSIIKYDESIDANTKSLTKSQEYEQKNIDRRYEIMTTQFLEYEKMINKISRQGDAVQDMIDAMRQAGK